jgi:hypothetical protein
LSLDPKDASVNLKQTLASNVSGEEPSHAIGERLHARACATSVAATNPARHGTTPTVLFNDRDIAASFFVGTVAPVVTTGITPPLFIRPLPFSLSTLAPAFTPLIFFLLGIPNANLRTTVRTNAELNGGLSHGGCSRKKAGTHRGRSEKSNLLHEINPLDNRDVTSDCRSGSKFGLHRGTLPYIGAALFAG